MRLRLRGNLWFQPRSRDEHGVTVGVEEVSLPDRGLVGGEDVFAAGEGADEHQEGRAGEVEVRQQGVRRMELEAWRDEDVRGETPVLARLEALRYTRGCREGT